MKDTLILAMKNGKVTGKKLLRFDKLSLQMLGISNYVINKLLVEIKNMDVGNISSKNLEENEDTCIVCYDDDRKYACIPCGHKCLCKSCIPSIGNCPVCNCQITSFQEIFDV